MVVSLYEAYADFEILTLFAAMILTGFTKEGTPSRNVCFSHKCFCPSTLVTLRLAGHQKLQVLFQIMVQMHPVTLHKSTFVR